MVREHYDAVIFGAGLYGLYAARLLSGEGRRVLVLEYDDETCSRATYVNQARVHMGYHYPRSIATAEKSRHYFQRFMDDFGFCVYEAFDQIYATSAYGSWTNAEQFEKFCLDAGIPCERVAAKRWFEPGLVDGAFLTKEYTYDARVLRDRLLGDISAAGTCEIRYRARLEGSVERDSDSWLLRAGGRALETPFVLNATYASVNQVNALFGQPPYRIKYELCEIILCDVCDELGGVGLTVMDGPFFSLMPFGMTGLHSLTSVTFTPHQSCFDDLPHFECMERNQRCSPGQLDNCNGCEFHPESAWPYMAALAGKYLADGLSFSKRNSLYSMKPILQLSEIDDSRPTAVRLVQEPGGPRFASVLSGKINTVYELDEILYE